MRAPGRTTEPHCVILSILLIFAGSLFVTERGLASSFGSTTEIIDATGDGAGATLSGTEGIDVDAAGNIYVVGKDTHNVFKIVPGSSITEIINASGDGTNPLTDPFDVAVDAAGNVYVSGSGSDNAFKITPGGTITQIIDATGDGSATLVAPFGLAVSNAGNVYVTGRDSWNCFKITTGGTITEIINFNGDGAGNGLSEPFSVAVDAAEHVYVAGRASDNVFEVTPGGVITEIIDASGDGAGNTLDCGNFVHCGVAVDLLQNVYVVAAGSDNAFKITPGGAVTEIIDAGGDGAGNTLNGPQGIDVAPSGNVYVAGGFGSDNAFRITPGGVITEIIDSSGDGAGSGLDTPDGFCIAVDGSDTVYLTGFFSKNAFAIPPGAAPPCLAVTEIIDANGDGVSSLVNPDGIALDSGYNVFTGGCGTSPGNSSVFKITPGGSISEILDGTGDGVHTFNCPVGIDVDSGDNVFVAGHRSDNVFKVTPGGAITQIMEAADGVLAPFDVAIDAADNVYVSGFGSDNAFKITPGGTITEIIDANGDGLGNTLAAPFGITVDDAGNVYVAGNDGNNSFKIAPGGTITEIIDATGDGVNLCSKVTDVGVDAFGNVFVCCNGSDNVFKITPGGVITQVMDSSVGLDNPTGLEVDAAGNVYVTAFDSDNSYRLTPGGLVTEFISSGGDGASPFNGPADDPVALDGDGNVYVTGTLSHNVFKVNAANTPTPSILDFGTVIIGEFADAAFTIENKQDCAISITIGESCGDFEVVSGVGFFTLDPGQTHNVTVRFQPSVVGAANCLVETDNGLLGEVVCTGTGGSTVSSLVQASGTPECISTANACVAVPVTITRTDATDVRGFSVTVQLSSELSLCGAGIAEGTYLSDIGTTSFQVLDAGGGIYTVDGVILGNPCGATAASGTLFTLNLGSATASGTGTVTITNVLLRDCNNQALAAAAGPAVDVPIDNTVPSAVLSATQVKSGNDGDGTTQIQLSWTGTMEPGDEVFLYRTSWGNYPEYDDVGGGAPAAPSFPPGAPWTAVATEIAPVAVHPDDPGARDFWYYVAFVKDPCGNVSAVAGPTAGTLNYHLGDVHNGGVACQGDNAVSTSDISFLGTNYGATLGAPPDVLACLDVGPTSDFSVDGRPTTDNQVQFEDLVMFGLNYEVVAGARLALQPAPLERDALTLAVPERVAAGETFTVSLRFSGSGAVRALSARLAWNEAVAEPVAVSAGALAKAQDAVVLSATPGTVDAAGLGRGLRGAGELATVTFRARAAGNPAVTLGSLDARDQANRRITLGAVTPQVTTVTALMPALPNPFGQSTTLGFALAHGGAVELSIFGVDGRRVATLVRETRSAGVHRVTWDGTDGAGHTLGAGIYFARLRTPQGVFNRSIVRVR